MVRAGASLNCDDPVWVHLGMAIIPALREKLWRRKLFSEEKEEAHSTVDTLEVSMEAMYNNEKDNYPSPFLASRSTKPFRAN